MRETFRPYQLFVFRLWPKSLKNLKFGTFKIFQSYVNLVIDYVVENLAINIWQMDVLSNIEKDPPTPGFRD